MSKKNKKGQVESGDRGDLGIISDEIMKGAKEPSFEDQLAKEATEDAAAQGTPVAEPKKKKKSYYNPEAAKARRVALMEAAKKGGYVPKERTPGTGKTEKRTSKTGTNYYYQPWSSLTQEQKDARLLAARKRNADDREMARKYREEHPEVKQEAKS